MKLTEDQEAVRDAYKQWTENIGMRENNLQYVFTPYSLCEEMVLKLKENTGLKKKNILVFNLEFAIVLMEQGVSPENITFLTDCIEKVRFAKKILGVAVMLEEFKKIIDEKRDLGKFDVVVGNPPYNDDSGNIGNAIWDNFVSLALEHLIVMNGYLVFVHPPKWRNPGSPLWNLMRKKQIHYMEIHDVNDGQRLFNASTNYDWYIMQNITTYTKTIIRGVDGETAIIDLSQISFIPNKMFDFVWKLLAKPNDEKIQIIYSYSNYEIRKPWMNKTPTEQHIHPCIRYISANDKVIDCWYSNTKDNGHFEIPKVVFGIGSNCGGFYFDKNGDYGLSQYAAGVIGDNLDKVYKVMNTPEFMEVMEACMTTTQKIHPKVFSLFKKDFWKEFIDDIEEE